MPWKECHVEDERLRFVARLLDGETMTGRMTIGRDAAPSSPSSQGPTVSLMVSQLLIRRHSACPGVFFGRNANDS